MIAQLLVCAVLVYVPFAAYLLYRKGRETGPSPAAQERLAQYTVRAGARSGNVTAAPVDPPLATVTTLRPLRVVRDDDEGRAA